MFVDLELQWS